MNRKNAYREEKSYCYFHPKQVVVGVCPLCLNERLLIVAAKQGHHKNHPSASKASHRLQSATSIHRKKAPTSIHKIIAFGSLFSSRQWKSENYEYDVSPTQEDSFISIKFEENGVASWEKSSTVSNKVSLENCNKMSWNHHSNKKDTNTNTNNNNNNNTKSVIEHGKSRYTLSWPKRIGHMFHLIRWKRTTTCHVGTKVEGVKVRKSWMRTLTKRKKTME